MSPTLPSGGRNRVAIERVTPSVDKGRFPVKRTLGDLVHVEADIFADGHDAIAAVLATRHSTANSWVEIAMQAGNNDVWSGEFTVSDLGSYFFTIRAWVDHFETWRRDLVKRLDAGTDSHLDYLIGAELIDAASGRAADTGTGSAADVRWLADRAAELRKEQESATRRQLAIDPALTHFMDKYPEQRFVTELDRDLEIVVDPVRARFSSWYELFPRSTSPEPARHGTLRDCAKRLPYIAEMGFDVVYLPPIHPIGRQFRKGPNNSTVSSPVDSGSPWAIGGPEGGHKSLHPGLGTLDDFRAMVRQASELGMQVAIDIAFQASPDHPYVTQHQNWFRRRPDGSIQYAENPPKKYQDIYPFDFESSEWCQLWEELRSVLLFWAEQGIRIFRVDNPHTKSFPFWEWVIAEVKNHYPEALFLSEAFTRPKVMYRLAKLGFSQSYTYFPWRTTKYELTSYFSEITKSPVRDFFRPNHWPNTPDILTEFLQTNGRAGFTMRLLLAATLGANYGIYGPAFELQEDRPLRAGSEEYLDSEKYQIRIWDWDRPDSLRELITLVNRIRREQAALQNDWTLEFHPINNDQLICYSKRSQDGSDLLVMVVNLDPHHIQSGYLELPLEDFRIDSNHPFQAHELLTGARYLWNGPRNFVELDPASVPAHIFRIRRRLRSEKDFEYFL